MSSKNPISRIKREKKKTSTSQQTDSVVNKTAYDEYQKLVSDGVFDFESYIVATSDEELFIDILRIEKSIKVDCSHLPKEEVRALVKIAKEAKNQLHQAVALYHKAYGLIQATNAYEIQVLEMRDIELIEYFGRYFTINDVHKDIILNLWQYNLSKQSLATYYNSRSSVILEKQRDHRNSITDIRLGHKRSRLEEYTWLYKNRKEIYERTLSAPDYKLLLETLRSIRQEVEGDIVTVNGGIDINIEHTVKNHIRIELINQLPLLQLIMAKVAHKINANPQYLMWRLQQSAYLKYNGFDPQSYSPDEQPNYPSTQTYDFAQIMKLNEHTHQESIDKLESTQKEDQVVTIEKPEEVLSFKERLQAKIQSVKNQAASQQLNTK